MNFNFDQFLESLKKAPGYVKDNVMCYFYHNTGACQDCPKTDCKAREPRQLSVAEMEKQGAFDPAKRAEYLVRICDYYVFAVPNPEVNFGLFEAVIKRLGSGEYVKFSIRRKAGRLVPVNFVRNLERVLPVILGENHVRKDSTSQGYVYC